MTTDRWGPTQHLLEMCQAKGLKVVECTDEDGLVHFPDWREAIFGSVAATYLPFEKTMYLNWKGLAEYGGYMGHIHELGHAVWSLLLTTQERWVGYTRLWGAARRAQMLLDWYAETKPEEGWAQDFEAFWTGEPAPGHMEIDHGRAELQAIDPVRYGFLRQVMTRLGADVEQVLDAGIE